MEDYLPFFRQKTFNEGESLVFQSRLAWDPWTPSWEISSRQGEWRPPPSELGEILPSLERDRIGHVQNIWVCID